MQSMLEEIGYEIVDNVIVYEQAEEVLRTQQVDLVLIDIILASDKTGIDLGKHIRENYDLPFIFVTSNSDRATVENELPWIPVLVRHSQGVSSCHPNRTVCQIRRSCGCQNPSDRF